jgi:hypothetical protein
MSKEGQGPHEGQGDLSSSLQMMKFILSLIFDFTVVRKRLVVLFQGDDSDSCCKFALENGYCFGRVDFCSKSFILAINC